MKPWSLGTRIAILSWVSLPLLFAMIFVAYSLSARTSVEGRAKYAGNLQAKVWFQENRQRLLELSNDPKIGFTGRKEGPFEVWGWTHYTNSSWLEVGDSDAVFVNAFNQRMKQLYNEKSKGQN